MIDYNKNEIKEQLTIDNIYELLTELGGNPEYTSFGILSETICHNPPGEGSKKLYLYSNSMLFHCFTGCDSFDVFELIIKVAKIQWKQDFDLNAAVRWIAQRFSISGTQTDAADPNSQLEDWKLLAGYNRIKDIEYKIQAKVILKEYDDDILDRFNYNLKIAPWLKEGITQEVLDNARIGYYLGKDQITIPHYDMNGNFIGLRGRCVCQQDAELYGKYRPVKVNNQLYTHPLGFNLYNLNNVKDNIFLMRKAIIFEGEKSVLKYRSFFGMENDISVACCGSNLSNYQVQMLRDCGADEIIIAFDRQFQKIGDEEFQHLKKNLLKLNNKYKNYIKISFVFDKNLITGYKDSPIDCGADTFLKLFKERIIL